MKRKRISNPYLAMFRSLRCIRPGGDLTGCNGLPNNSTEKLRHKMVELYAYAIPNVSALKMIATYSGNGVVEIGAGLGYWAWLLRERGVDVLAFDKQPDPKKNWYYASCAKAKLWTTVKRGNENSAARHGDRTLLLCWPEPRVASRCLDKYRGETVIFIGERNCCNLCGGYRSFFAKLDSGFKLVAEQSIPNWPGCGDRVYVYQRQ